MARRWIKSLTARTVLVHTRDSRTLRGALVGVHDDCLVLDHAAYVIDDTTTDLAGRAVVPRENVSFVQELIEVAR